MKLTRLLPALALAASLTACQGADEPTDQKEGAASFTCGGASVATQNPSMQNVTMTWSPGGGVTWHSPVKLLTDFGGVHETQGFAYFEVDKPTENPPGTWPLYTMGVRINGTSIQLLTPAENPGFLYEFEGQTTVTGPFPGGSVSMSGLVYTGAHQVVGSFSTTVGVSGGTTQWLSGIPLACPYSTPQTLHSPFAYNLEIGGGANGPIWFPGTVTVVRQNGAYVQLKLSDPHYRHDNLEPWAGDAFCTIDQNDNLGCNVHTGQGTFNGDIGDPIWTAKGLATGYMYQYTRQWDFESTGWFMDYTGF